MDGVSKRANTQLVDVGDTIQHRTDLLNTAVDEATERLQRVNENLSENSAEAAVAVDVNVSKLNSAIDMFRRQTQETGVSVDGVGGHLEGVAEALRRQVYNLGNTYQRTEQGMEALSGAVQRRAGELSSATETALAKVAAWDRHVRSHADALSQTTAQAAESAEVAARLMESQTQEMRETTNEARTLIETLKERRGKAAMSDFMQQAGYVNERLQSLAVDMNRVLETTISEDDWRRYNKGETGVFVRKMLGFREKVKLNIVRDKYQRDGEFRDYVTRYLGEFDELLGQANNLDQGSLLRGTFLASDVGKVYMLLARALGRDIVTGE